MACNQRGWPMRRPAIIIVTFKRQELLGVLFDSILTSTVAPWRIVVVDNENSQQTAQLVEAFSARVCDAWGTTDDDPDAEGGTARVVYVAEPKNIGGSGGFSHGVRRAYELGAEWFWLMDDDVAIEAEGLERLSQWTERYKVVQGQRYDFDGGPFYWQYRFWVPLGIYNPFATSKFDGSGCKPTNVSCFEGGLYAREVVRRIGFPDERFFLYWDDAIYGYLASKICEPVVVSDFVLRRTREMRNVGIGSVRQLNASSDMTRYYITRNRGHMARYFQLTGDFNRVAFGLGTFLTFAKEIIRILAVDRGHFRSGVGRLFAGWRDARKILRDPAWEPMPSLTDEA